MREFCRKQKLPVPFSVNDTIFQFQIFRFSHLMPYTTPMQQNKLCDEFLDFQLLDESDIPTCVWENSKSENSYHRMDVIWAFLTSMKSSVTGMPRFPTLGKVAQLVLILPHSNADAERVFSMIGLNKTETRNSLALEGTLSSIMTMKMSNMEPCYKYEPSDDVIKASKKATSQYNKEHS